MAATTAAVDFLGANATDAELLLKAKQFLANGSLEKYANNTSSLKKALAPFPFHVKVGLVSKLASHTDLKAADTLSRSLLSVKEVDDCTDSEDDELIVVIRENAGSVALPYHSHQLALFIAAASKNSELILNELDTSSTTMQRLAVREAFKIGKSANRRGPTHPKTSNDSSTTTNSLSDDQLIELIVRNEGRLSTGCRGLLRGAVQHHRAKVLDAVLPSLLDAKQPVAKYIHGASPSTVKTLLPQCLKLTSASAEVCWKSLWRFHETTLLELVQSELEVAPFLTKDTVWNTWSVAFKCDEALVPWNKLFALYVIHTPYEFTSVATPAQSAMLLEANVESIAKFKSNAPIRGKVLSFVSRMLKRNLISVATLLETLHTCCFTDSKSRPTTTPSSPTPWLARNFELVQKALSALPTYSTRRIQTHFESILSMLTQLSSLCSINDLYVLTTNELYTTATTIKSLATKLASDLIAAKNKTFDSSLTIAQTLKVLEVFKVHHAASVPTCELFGVPTPTNPTNTLPPTTPSGSGSVSENVDNAVVRSVVPCMIPASTVSTKLNMWYGSAVYLANKALWSMAYRRAAVAESKRDTSTCDAALNTIIDHLDLYLNAVSTSQLSSVWRIVDDLCVRLRRDHLSNLWSLVQTKFPTKLRASTTATTTTTPRTRDTVSACLPPVYAHVCAITRACIAAEELKLTQQLNKSSSSSLVPFSSSPSSSSPSSSSSSSSKLVPHMPTALSLLIPTHEIMRLLPEDIAFSIVDALAQHHRSLTPASTPTPSSSSSSSSYAARAAGGGSGGDTKTVTLVHRLLATHRDATLERVTTAFEFFLAAAKHVGNGHVYELELYWKVLSVLPPVLQQSQCDRIVEHTKWRFASEKSSSSSSSSSSASVSSTSKAGMWVADLTRRLSDSLLPPSVRRTVAQLLLQSDQVSVLKKLSLHNTVLLTDDGVRRSLEKACNVSGPTDRISALHDLLTVSLKQYDPLWEGGGASLDEKDALEARNAELRRAAVLQELPFVVKKVTNEQLDNRMLFFGKLEELIPNVVEVLLAPNTNIDVLATAINAQRPHWLALQTDALNSIASSVQSGLVRSCVSTLASIATAFMSAAVQWERHRDVHNLAARRALLDLGVDMLWRQAKHTLRGQQLELEFTLNTFTRGRSRGGSGGDFVGLDGTSLVEMLLDQYGRCLEHTSLANIESHASCQRLTHLIQLCGADYVKVERLYSVLNDIFTNARVHDVTMVRKLATTIKQVYPSHKLEFRGNMKAMDAPESWYRDQLLVDHYNRVLQRGVSVATTTASTPTTATTTKTTTTTTTTTEDLVEAIDVVLTMRCARLDLLHAANTIVSSLSSPSPSSSLSLSSLLSDEVCVVNVLREPRRVRQRRQFAAIHHVMLMLGDTAATIPLVREHLLRWRQDLILSQHLANPTPLSSTALTSTTSSKQGQGRGGGGGGGGRGGGSRSRGRGGRRGGGGGGTTTTTSNTTLSLSSAGSTDPWRWPIIPVTVPFLRCLSGDQVAHLHHHLLTDAMNPSLPLVERTQAANMATLLPGSCEFSVIRNLFETETQTNTPNTTTLSDDMEFVSIDGVTSTASDMDTTTSDKNGDGDVNDGDDGDVDVDDHAAADAALPKPVALALLRGVMKNHPMEATRYLLDPTVLSNNNARGLKAMQIVTIAAKLLRPNASVKMLKALLNDQRRCKAIGISGLKEAIRMLYDTQTTDAHKLLLESYSYRCTSHGHIKTVQLHCALRMLDQDSSRLLVEPELIWSVLNAAATDTNLPTDTRATLLCAEPNTPHMSQRTNCNNASGYPQHNDSSQLLGDGSLKVSSGQKQLQQFIDQHPTVRCTSLEHCTQLGYLRLKLAAPAPAPSSTTTNNNDNNDTTTTTTTTTNTNTATATTIDSNVEGNVGGQDSTRPPTKRRKKQTEPANDVEKREQERALLMEDDLRSLALCSLVQFVELTPHRTPLDFAIEQRVFDAVSSFADFDASVSVDASRRTKVMLNLLPTHLVEISAIKSVDDHNAITPDSMLASVVDVCLRELIWITPMCPHRHRRVAASERLKHIMQAMKAGRFFHFKPPVDEALAMSQVRKVKSEREKFTRVLQDVVVLARCRKELTWLKGEEKVDRFAVVADYHRSRSRSRGRSRSRSRANGHTAQDDWTYGGGYDRGPRSSLRWSPPRRSRSPSPSRARSRSRSRSSSFSSRSGSGSDSD